MRTTPKNLKNNKPKRRFSTSSAAATSRLKTTSAQLSPKPVNTPTPKKPSTRNAPLPNLKTSSPKSYASLCRCKLVTRWNKSRRRLKKTKAKRKKMTSSHPFLRSLTSKARIWRRKQLSRLRTKPYARSRNAYSLVPKSYRDDWSRSRRTLRLSSKNSSGRVSPMEIRIRSSTLRKWRRLTSRSIFLRREQLNTIETRSKSSKSWIRNCKTIPV